ncbi:MAG TPA: NAD(P)-binding protein [Tabrizicola sp.]|nr:NAD(P)-binding protein [Tabrizicola sp.]
MSAQKKTRILAIGGGVGTMTAIYALTRLPDWQDKFDITVYQLGWRLGGKGASGRNAVHGERIEEHGLHVWGGFYDNAFRNLRDCYEELQRLGLRMPDAPLATIDQAFKPLRHLFLSEDVPRADGNGVDWRPWLIDLPGNDQVPGTATSVPTPFETFKRAIAILLEFISRHELDDASEETDALRSAGQRLKDGVAGLSARASDHVPSQRSLLADLLAEAQRAVHARMTPAAIQDDAQRRILMLADLGLAYAHGMASSDAFTQGYDCLDQWEFTEWLRANGASELALKSVLVRGCYDFVFGFSAGNIHRANVGAGTAARAMGRLILSYSGAIFQKMQAGMGDTIFTPYYQVLEKIGVKFRFFHAVSALRLTQAGTDIAAVEMIRQAEVLGESYQPLRDVKGLPCWPSEPDWGQLKDGEALRNSGINFESEAGPIAGKPVVMKLGEDFDKVLLGASIGSLGYMTKDLADASPRWAQMLKSLKTVGTQAAQFWLDKSFADMGWDGLVAKHNNAAAIPKGPLQTVMTGFAEPLDTVADMSHLIPVEDWQGKGPASIAYFCSPAPDGQTLEKFTAETRAWVKNDLPAIWPKADPVPYHQGGLEDQYLRVNMFGSERYVLSVQGSLYHRLAPGESGFYNLVLAGDWTRCGLNAGCVEAATMSGIAAATALSGVEILNVGADDLADDGALTDTAAFKTFSVTAANWPITGFFARGEMTGWFVFYAMPRADVAELLPKGVVLGHSAMVPPGMHPVGMSFCRYHNVRSSFLPQFLGFPPYNEATFAIPDCRTDEGGPAPFLYPRRLYVDNNAAIMAGKIFYAMNKSRATLDWEEATFTGSNPEGLMIDSHFIQTDDALSLANHPAMGTVAQMLGTAFVTESSRCGLLYNAFDLQLDKAWIAPVHGRVKVKDPMTGGFPEVDLDFDPLLPRATRTLPGAFRIWCSWSMTNPLDSKRIRQAAKARSFLGGI